MEADAKKLEALNAEEEAVKAGKQAEALEAEGRSDEAEPFLQAKLHWDRVARDLQTEASKHVAQASEKWLDAEAAAQEV